MLSNEELEMKCPSCQRMLSYSIDQLQKGQSIKCSYCNTEVKFEEENSGAVRKLEEKTKKSLEEIPKKITVRMDE